MGARIELHKRGRPKGSSRTSMEKALTQEQQVIAKLGLRIVSTAYSNGLSVAAALAAARIYIGNGRTTTARFAKEAG